MSKPYFDDPDLPLVDLFAAWPEAAAMFLARRMLCPGCPIAPFHAITDACLEYDLDEDDFRAELKKLLSEDRASCGGRDNCRMSAYPSSS